MYFRISFVVLALSLFCSCRSRTDDTSLKANEGSVATVEFKSVGSYTYSNVSAEFSEEAISQWWNPEDGKRTELTRNLLTLTLGNKEQEAKKPLHVVRIFDEKNSLKDAIKQNGTFKVTVDGTNFEDISIPGGNFDRPAFMIEPSLVAIQDDTSALGAKFFSTHSSASNSHFNGMRGYLYQPYATRVQIELSFKENKITKATIQGNVREVLVNFVGKPDAGKSIEMNAILSGIPLSLRNRKTYISPLLSWDKKEL